MGAVDFLSQHQTQTVEEVNENKIDVSSDAWW